MLDTHLDAQATAAQATYGVHWRLILEHADGSMVDFRTLSGIDWCDSVEWGKDVDDTGCKPQIKIRREVGSLSLAPLVEDSTLNRVLSAYEKRVHLARKFRIEIAITEAGASPDSEDWFVVVRGVTEEVEWGGKASTITISARDEMELLDFLILTGDEKSFGSTAGDNLEDVMQELVNHYLQEAAPTLYFSAPLGFLVTNYKTKAGQTLKESLDTLAGHVGGFVEDRWVTEAGGFAIHVTLPYRDSETATPSATFGPDQYLEVRRMGWAARSIRNYLRMRVKEAGTGRIITRTVTDEESITELGGAPRGIRAIEFTEEEGSAIDTVEEVDNFLALAKADLSTPLVQQEVENLFWPWVELCDYYTWLANGKVTDVDFTWAVVGFRHVLSGNSRRTTIRTSGQAKGGSKRYSRRHRGGAYGSEPDLLAFRVISETNAQVILGWDPTPDIEQEWAAQKTVPNMLGDKWAGVADSVAPIFTTDHRITVDKPAQGFLTLVRVEGRSYDPVKMEYTKLAAWHREVHPPEFQPRIIEVTVLDDNRVKVVADPKGTASLKLERADGGGTWSYSVDGNVFIFDVPRPEGEIWGLNAYAYIEPVVEVGPETFFDVWPFLLGGFTPGEGGEPLWAAVNGFAPDMGESEIGIELQATADPGGGYYGKIFVRKILEGVGVFTDVTAEVTAEPLELPVLSSQIFLYDTEYPRSAPGGASFSFTVQVRALMYNPADELIDMIERNVTYYTEGPVE